MGKEDQASFYAYDMPLSLQNKVLSQIAPWAVALHSILLALNPNYEGFLKWLCILEEALVFNLLCLCRLTEVKNNSFQNIRPGSLDDPRATWRKEVIREAIQTSLCFIFWQHYFVFLESNWFSESKVKKKSYCLALSICFLSLINKCEEEKVTREWALWDMLTEHCHARTWDLTTGSRLISNSLVSHWNPSSDKL